MNSVHREETSQVERRVTVTAVERSEKTSPVERGVDFGVAAMKKDQ